MAGVLRQGFFPPGEARATSISRSGSVRSEQRSLERKGLPPFGLRPVWPVASLLVGHSPTAGDAPSSRLATGQTPSSKEEPSSKLKNQPARRLPPASVLGVWCFEIWNFSGAWGLVHGVSLSGGEMRLPR